LVADMASPGGRTDHAGGPTEADPPAVRAVGPGALETAHGA